MSATLNKTLKTQHYHIAHFGLYFLSIIARSRPQSNTPAVIVLIENNPPPPKKKNYSVDSCCLKHTRETENCLR